MSLYRVYLSGTMTGRKIGPMLAERKRADKLLRKHDITAYDPAVGEEQHWKKGKVPSNLSPKIMKKFVKQDLKLVDACDAVLVLTGDNCSDGTWHEMIYAKRKKKYVVLIAPKRASGKLVTWSTVLYPCVATLDEAVKLILKEARRAR